MRKELAELIKKPAKTTFNAAQASVWKVMEHDSFPKFLQSDKLKNFRGLYQLNLNFPKSDTNLKLGKLTPSIEAEIKEMKNRPRSRSNTVWVVENYLRNKQ